MGVPVCVVCADDIKAVEFEHKFERERERKGGKGGGDDNDDDDDDDDDNNNNEPTPPACSACGKREDDITAEAEDADADEAQETEDFWVCTVCARRVCPKCLEQAHGGDSNTDTDSDSNSDIDTDSDSDSDDARSAIRSRSRSRNNRTNWRCFCGPCADATPEHDLPPLLRVLRTKTRELLVATTAAKTKHKHKHKHKQHTQSIGDALGELRCLESEKRSCELKLEREEFLLKTIRRELVGESRERGGDDCDDDDDSDEEEDKNNRLLERRVRGVHQEWIDHHTRLLDRIAILQDKLKANHNIDAHAAFRMIRKYVGKNGFRDGIGDGAMDYDSSSSSSESDASETDTDNEPYWKLSADRAIEKRKLAEKSERKQAELEQNFDPRYSMELDNDAEELESCDDSNKKGDDSNSNSNSNAPDLFDLGWRNHPIKASDEQMMSAQRSEDLRRLEEGKTKLIVRYQNTDRLDLERWDAGLKLKLKRNRASAEMTKPEPVSTKRPRTRTITAPKHGSGDYRSRSPLTHTHTDGGIHPAVIGRSMRNNHHTHGDFHQPSSLVLSHDPFISVDKRIETHLKEHQKEAIRFMFQNSFADLGGGGDSNDDDDEEEESTTPIDIGGCILAHSMGLGKSLSCIALLQTIMLQPSLVDTLTDRGKIYKTLLVVPVNTLVNWENEFIKWTRMLPNRLTIFNVSSATMLRRDAVAERWSNEGGILLTSDAMFRSMTKIESIQKLLAGADSIVLDESHKMLKKKDNQVFKAFLGIKTKRRICLTGTPFQNNLLEFHLMVSYIRPNLLGESVAKFQNEYSDPIQAGMGTDAPREKKAIADERLESLCDKLKPFVHRKDASLLLKDLPPLQQVCLHLRPTKLQRSLYKAYKEHRRAKDDNNFLRQYAYLRLVHNHPGTLLPKEDYDATGPGNNINGRQSARNQLNGISGKKKPTKPSLHFPFDSDDDSSDDDFDDYDYDYSDDGSESEETSSEWWRRTAEKFGSVKMNDAHSGNKCIVLLHILAHATLLGEKTVVFSQSLKTLDYLSRLLASKDWLELCPSLRQSFPGLSIGGWLKGKDFLRLDGATSGSERGDQLSDFNWDKRLKLFLISSVAGGIGINLVSANRVVLFDSHFNPSIDLQAIYRCYRYGQERSVFAYRLLTQGSLEERVYSRAVTKISLGNRVVDGKELHRCFTTDEIDSLVREDDWVECVRCQKWRMFPDDHKANISKLPRNWFCELMNQHDFRIHWACGVPERDSEWYRAHFRTPNWKTATVKIESGAAALPAETGTEARVQRDDVLQKLVTISSQGENPTKIVSRHYFHDALLSDVDTAMPN